jgi:hypothetical protein
MRDGGTHVAHVVKIEVDAAVRVEEQEEEGSEGLGAAMRDACCGTCTR